jgi:hypothetical protein
MENQAPSANEMDSYTFTNISTMTIILESVGIAMAVYDVTEIF